MTRRTPRQGLGGGRPGSRRPAPRSTPARTRTTEPPRSRPRFTNRAAILLVIFAVLVVSYASSMRAYLRQQQHISDLQDQIASAQRAIAEGEREKRRWKDPAFVQAQARERFGWVLPGETAYQVIGRDGKPLAGDDGLTDPGTVAQPPKDAWWTTVHGSVQQADHPRKPKPTPTGQITPPPRPQDDQGGESD